MQTAPLSATSDLSIFLEKEREKKIFDPFGAYGFNWNSVSCRVSGFVFNESMDKTIVGAENVRREKIRLSNLKRKSRSKDPLKANTEIDRSIKENEKDKEERLFLSQFRSDCCWWGWSILSPSLLGRLVYI